MMQNRLTLLRIPLLATLLPVLFLHGLVAAPEVRRSPAPKHQAVEPAAARDRLTETELPTSRTAIRRGSSAQVDDTRKEISGIEDLVPPHYRELLLATAARHGLDPRLVAAVITVETRFDRSIVGSHGEVGLMQIMADTGAFLARHARLSTYDLTDDATSLDLGCLYLEILLREYGSVERALAVYNGGPRGAERWQTSPYVARVLQFYKRSPEPPDAQ
jgi:soluble lytic murein transglycosylase-like protein